MDQTTPNLAALLADPEAFRSLPRGEQDSIYAGVAGLESFMRAHIMVSRLSSHEAPPPEPDRAVPIKEAAKLLSTSVDFLYRNWRSYNGYKDRDGKIKFRAAHLHYYLVQKHKGR